MKVCCLFSLLESPHRGDSNEYTQQTIIINIKKKKITLNHPKHDDVCSYGISSDGLKNEFEISEVNEPSVFKPLKFVCTLDSKHLKQASKCIIVAEIGSALELTELKEIISFFHN